MGTQRKYSHEGKNKRRNFKKGRGDGEYEGGNPYRSKPDFRATEPGDPLGFFSGGTRRSWYGDGAKPSTMMAENGVPAFDSGRPSD